MAKTTGINEPESNKYTIFIYPNPFNDNARIVINSRIPLETTEIKLLDIFGRTVKAYDELQTNEIILLRDNLDGGIYFYQVINKGLVIGSGKVLVE